MGLKIAKGKGEPMAEVIFYEKPGCQGNARQKALLEQAGHTVLARSLKTTVWTKDSLLEFLGPLPVADWFNRSAPAVKVGQIVPEALDAASALPLLLENPLLIRRPLMQVGECRQVGFDAVAVHAWIGLGDSVPEGNLEACVHGPEGHTCHGHDHDEAGEECGEGHSDGACSPA